MQSVRRSPGAARRRLSLHRLVWLGLVGVGLAAPAGSESPEEMGLPAGIVPAPPPDSATRARLLGRGLPFGPGEHLEFGVTYGPIRAGTATLEVRDMRRYRDRLCYHFVSQAKSAPVFDSVYKVRDRIDALVDHEGFHTWQYRKRQREGGYSADYEIQYDPVESRATYADGRAFPIPERALDALSAFYFARLQPLSENAEFYIPHHSDRKTFYLRVGVLRRETVEVPAGEFDCWVLEPLVRDAGPFKHQGRVTVWITADERRMPVLMKSSVGVGSIAVSLERMTSGAPAARAAVRDS